MANASDIFENLSRTFTKTADKMAKKTDEFISVQKVKGKQSSLEHQVNSTYRSIGKIICSEYAAGNPVSEEIADLCEKVVRLQKEIEECRSEIADIKGVTACQSCGNPIPAGADFCSKCGSPRPEEDTPEDAEFDDADDEETDPEESDETAEDSRE